MEDIRQEDIFEDDNIAFIKNKRGEAPRLVFGQVKAVGYHSIEVQDASGEIYEVRFSQRSLNANRLLNAVVILPRDSVTGDVLDITGHPILPADKVAFMEAPSQGFSTALVVGRALHVTPDGVTILVDSATSQKYKRKPDEIVVIEQTGGNGNVLP